MVVHFRCERLPVDVSIDGVSIGARSAAVTGRLHVSSMREAWREIGRVLVVPGEWDVTIERVMRSGAVRVSERRFAVTGGGGS